MRSYFTIREVRGRLFRDSCCNSFIPGIYNCSNTCLAYPCEGIEHQSLIIKNLLVTKECYNEPDAAALKQPFSLAF